MDTVSHIKILTAFVANNRHANVPGLLTTTRGVWLDRPMSKRAADRIRHRMAADIMTMERFACRRRSDVAGHIAKARRLLAKWESL